MRQPRREESRVLFAVLDQLDPTSVTRHLDRLAAKNDPRRRSGVVLLLGRYGQSRHVETLFGLLTVAANEEAPDRRLVLGFEDALVALLGREDSAVRRIRGRWGSASSSVQGAVLSALGRSGTREAFKFLVYLIQENIESPNRILAQVDRFAPSLAPSGAQDVAELVREFLWGDDAEVQKAAVLTLGRLHDEEAVPRLVEFLDSEDPGLKANALWSLQRISGRTFSAPRAWRKWLEDELLWLETNEPILVESLHSRRPQEVAAALQSVSRRRMSRDRLAELVLSCLEHEEPSIRRLTCLVLGQLSSSHALPGLVDLLRDADDGVHAAAHGALRTITGRDLPADLEVWEELIEEIAAS